MTADICTEAIISQSKLSETDRNLPFVKKSWDKLSKIADLAAVGDLVLKLSPVIATYFGITF